MFRFDKLCKASQIRFLEQAKNNDEYAKLIGYHVGIAYNNLDEDIKNKVIQVARNSRVFYSKFIEGIKQTMPEEKVKLIENEIEYTSKR
ncbi:hypothetical protein [Acidianus manzaensis]|uniref:Uncharacterized protein n=1 Tax=Acidianus manzaensis TaxID=282676 RepID=A0A1W6JX22_9CREN|nr:hypothetical protein [Acidianus manzaensis]ARM74813.1 hypothetical protein B6F84_01415 [Acidianus manzaensis]